MACPVPLAVSLFLSVEILCLWAGNPGSLQEILCLWVESLFFGVEILDHLVAGRVLEAEVTLFAVVTVQAVIALAEVW